ncbi:MAG TPA: transglutaminase-like domain-containing protein [Chitinophagaceae bacterium]
MKPIFITCLLLTGFIVKGQQPAVYIPADTTDLNIQNFASSISAGSSQNFEKAKTILNWLSSNFEWTATDYQKRTVKEIIIRKGGNCFELATVYMALLKELNIIYRPIAEINMHVLSDNRQQTAEQKILASGNRMSVFGRRHNDHRWVEIFDDTNNQWVPADPTMGIIGFEQWLKARAWFGERHTIADDVSKNMIAPFAIFVADKNRSSVMIEDRSSYYMVEKLDSLYGNKLSELPSWNNWVEGLKNLNAAARNAFAGSENLHNYTSQIEALTMIYDQLKKEYITLNK